MSKPSLSEIAQIMQKNMLEAQEKLRKRMVTGESGAGLVKIEFNCLREVQSVKLDPGLFTDNAPEVIQPLIASAISDGMKKIDKATQEEVMADLGKGLNLPDMGEDEAS